MWTIYYYCDNGSINVPSRSTCSCHLCQAVESTKHAASLFSRFSIAQRLASRVSELLQVTVASHDGLRQHICNVCKRRFESLQKAAKDLEEFRIQASKTYGLLTHTRGSLKRSKESSAVVGVSPDMNYFMTIHCVLYYLTTSQKSVTLFQHKYEHPGLTPPSLGLVTDIDNGT